MPLSEIYPDERAAEDVHLSASVRQLEALTALAAAPRDRRALEELFAGLADTITRLTDYRTCLVVLFNDEGPQHRHILSHSSNVPREYIEKSGARPYPRDQVIRFIEQGVRIEVGELGYAAYYPPSHYHLLDGYNGALHRHLQNQNNGAGLLPYNAPGVPLGTNVTPAARAPYPEFPAGIELTEGGGRGSYNGLGIKLTQRFQAGLTTLISYTWAGDSSPAWAATLSAGCWARASPASMVPRAAPSVVPVARASSWAAERAPRRRASPALAARAAARALMVAALDSMAAASATAVRASATDTKPASNPAA